MAPQITTPALRRAPNRGRGAVGAALSFPCGSPPEPLGALRSFPFPRAGSLARPPDAVKTSGPRHSPVRNPGVMTPPTPRAAGRGDPRPRAGPEQRLALEQHRPDGGRRLRRTQRSVSLGTERAPPRRADLPPRPTALGPLIPLHLGVASTFSVGRWDPHGSVPGVAPPSPLRPSPPRTAPRPWPRALLSPAVAPRPPAWRMLTYSTTDDGRGVK